MVARLRVKSLVFLTTILWSVFVWAQKAQPVSVFVSQLTEVWKPPRFAIQDFLGYSPTTFNIPEELKSEVSFWIDIYSKYSTQQGVFHLSGNTNKILGEIDLSQVYANPKWGPIRKEIEAEKIIKRQKKLIAKKHGITDLKKIRLQTGLNDRMLKAIQVSGRYLPMMEKIFKEENIPLELIRVVFVESSFNIEAGSRVGASGLWQIMPIVAKKSKYINEAHDLRQHPVYSTKLAAKILKQNYQILKSWPLAVTAYNHGVGSLGKIVKKYKSNDISYLIRNVESKKSFGFASRNFYATFLAALYVESHANLYFAEPLLREAEMKFKDVKVQNKMAYQDLLSSFDNNLTLLKFYNPQLKLTFLKKKKYLPFGTVISLPKPEVEPVAIEQEEGT